MLSWKYKLRAASAFAAAAVGFGAWAQSGGAAPPGGSNVPKQWGVRIVAAYPHDPVAFTQGLVIDHGQLFEGTGLNGKSSIRRVDLETGKVEKIEPISSLFFGEGIAILGDKLYELTWQNQVGFIYDVHSFKRLGEFRYTGEGWGLAQDGRNLILSDGTPTIRFLDPQSFEVVKTIEVRLGGRPLSQLNELEYIDGQIWSNIWHDDHIARISPQTGEVLGLIDLSSVYTSASRGPEDVLNGIAYDAATKKIYVTGKDWPKLYQVEVVPK
jgi:glutamine cyclotransferase